MENKNSWVAPKGKDHPNWKGGLPKCLECGKRVTNYVNKRCSKCKYKDPIFKKAWLRQRKVWVKKSCGICSVVYSVIPSREKTSIYCSNKCRITSIKAKKLFVNENNPSWKGDDVGYWGLHHWVIRNLGQPDICDHCGKSGLKGKAIHWANKSHKYKRDLSDWLRLCVRCHKIYDGLFGETWSNKIKEALKH